MTPALQISNYKVCSAPRDFEFAVKNFIFMRRHKQITIQKPLLDYTATDKQWHDPERVSNSINFFKTEEEEKQQALRVNKVLVSTQVKEYRFPWGMNIEKSVGKEQHTKANGTSSTDKNMDIQENTKHLNDYAILKTKIIQKAGKATPHKEKQRKVQKMYSKYLLNFLHKSNLLLIQNNIPPNLSLLQTIQDGDYLKDGQRKDYPHFSNVIQPIDLPAPTLQPRRIIRQPVFLIGPHQSFSSIESTTVFKLKHVSLLLTNLFKQSIKACQTIREMNFKGDLSLRLENENHNFVKLAEIIGVNFQTAKLLFDMLNDHYDLEKELALGRSDDYKAKVCRELLELLEGQVKEYFGNKKMQEQNGGGDSDCSKLEKASSNYSCFTPLEEYYLSLKDLRDIFIQVHNKPMVNK